MPSVTIEPWECCVYREVWMITERKEGAIFRTQPTGKYCHCERPIQPNEYYASVPTRITRQTGKITLELVE